MMYLISTKQAIPWGKDKGKIETVDYEYDDEMVSLANLTSECFVDFFGNLEAATNWLRQSLRAEIVEVLPITQPEESHDP
jgi:hypothetical protein